MVGGDLPFGRVDRHLRADRHGALTVALRHVGALDLHVREHAGEVAAVRGQESLEDLAVLVAEGAAPDPIGRRLADAGVAWQPSLS